MKMLLLLCLLTLPTLLRAQSNVFQGLPVDSASGKITYQGVVQVPGVSKTELYSRAREWAAIQLCFAKDVLQMDDKEAGKLIAKGLVQRKIPSVSLTSIGNNNFWRTIKIYVKDGRYRYEITDFTLDSPYESGTMEKRIEVAAGQVFSGSKSNSPKGHYKYLLSAVAETTEPEVISLEKAMSGNGRKEKDF